MREILLLAGWAAGGAMLGVIYFRMVRHSADLLLSRRRGGAWFGLALVLLRVAGLGGVLVISAMQGAWPLLATGVGLWIGRFVVLRTDRGVT